MSNRQLSICILITPADDQAQISGIAPPPENGFFSAARSRWNERLCCYRSPGRDKSRYICLSQSLRTDKNRFSHADDLPAPTPEEDLSAAISIHNPALSLTFAQSLIEFISFFAIMKQIVSLFYYLPDQPPETDDKTGACTIDFWARRILHPAVPFADLY